VSRKRGWQIGEVSKYRREMGEGGKEKQPGRRTCNVQGRDRRSKDESSSGEDVQGNEEKEGDKKSKGNREGGPTLLRANGRSCWRLSKARERYSLTNSRDLGGKRKPEGNMWSSLQSREPPEGFYKGELVQ